MERIRSWLQLALALLPGLPQPSPTWRQSQTAIQIARLILQQQTDVHSSLIDDVQQHNKKPNAPCLIDARAERICDTCGSNSCAPEEWLPAHSSRTFPNIVKTAGQGAGCLCGCSQRGALGYWGLGGSPGCRDRPRAGPEPQNAQRVYCQSRESALGRRAAHFQAASHC